MNVVSIDKRLRKLEERSYPRDVEASRMTDAQLTRAIRAAGPPSPEVEAFLAWANGRDWNAPCPPAVAEWLRREGVTA